MMRNMNIKILLAGTFYITAGIFAGVTEHPFLLFTALPVSAFLLGLFAAEEDCKQKSPKTRKCCCQSSDEWCWENNKELKYV